MGLQLWGSALWVARPGPMKVRVQDKPLKPSLRNHASLPRPVYILEDEWILIPNLRRLYPRRWVDSSTKFQEELDHVECVSTSFPVGSGTKPSCTSLVVVSVRGPWAREQFKDKDLYWTLHEVLCWNFQGFLCALMNSAWGAVLKLSRFSLCPGERSMRCCLDWTFQGSLSGPLELPSEAGLCLWFRKPH
jgi:hypothetical protein